MNEWLERLGELPAAVAVRSAAPVLDTIVQGHDVERAVARLMACAERGGGGPVDEVLARPGGCTVQVFVWPRGARTTIHDHSSWGVYACLDGALGEDRYERLDDESVFGVAHVRRAWQAIWTPGQRSMLGPYAGGIHRVYNAGLRPAVSMHLYGPRLSEIDGRDYDARSSVVCDRAADDEGNGVELVRRAGRVYR